MFIAPRDRLGIKPLYLVDTEDLTQRYRRSSNSAPSLVFAMEPDRDVLAEYLRSGHELPGRTFFEGIQPMPAGTWLEIDVKTGRRSPFHSYWNPVATGEVSDASEAATLFHAALAEAVALEMRSDVPVGCAAQRRT